MSACPVCFRPEGSPCSEEIHESQRVLDNLPEPTVRPCAECPWVRTAVAGHLGPHTPEEWVEMAHGESPIACHMTIDHADQDWTELRQCAGSAVFRANVYKTPRHPLVALGERDTETVFAWDNEFIDHHQGEP